MSKARRRAVGSGCGCWASGLLWGWGTGAPRVASAGVGEGQEGEGPSGIANTSPGAPGTRARRQGLHAGGGDLPLRPVGLTRTPEPQGPAQQGASVHDQRASALRETSTEKKRSNCHFSCDCGRDIPRSPTCHRRPQGVAGRREGTGRVWKINGPFPKGAGSSAKKRKLQC